MVINYIFIAGMALGIVIGGLCTVLGFYIGAVLEERENKRRHSEHRLWEQERKDRIPSLY